MGEAKRRKTLDPNYGVNKHKAFMTKLIHQMDECGKKHIIPGVVVERQNINEFDEKVTEIGFVPLEDFDKAFSSELSAKIKAIVNESEDFSAIKVMYSSTFAMCWKSDITKSQKLLDVNNEGVA
jgi:hypothetical protein